MTDLNLLIQFLVDQFPGFRFNLFNWHLTGGYQADIHNTFGTGSSPLTCVLDLIRNLGLSAQDYDEWFVKQLI
jgi:hypothetical protein